ncbi:MAG TPA: hypothetical protein VJ869_15380 [Sphaerochaeta sp.]|nr:hypothetical protein [Sphaerochaeta sp.]
MEDHDDYYEDAFDMQEINNMLKGKAKEEMESLQSSKKYLENKNKQYQKELFDIKQQNAILLRDRETYEKKLREETIQSLLSEFNKTFWYVKREQEKYPKCSKCDEDRRVEYKSADGLTMLGKCTCNKLLCTYSVEKARATSIKIFDHEFLLYLARDDEENEDKYEYYSNNPNSSYSWYFDPPKEKWKDIYYSGVVFTSKETAEEFVALRNSKKEQES